MATGSGYLRIQGNLKRKPPEVLAASLLAAEKWWRGGTIRAAMPRLDQLFYLALYFPITLAKLFMLVEFVRKIGLNLDDLGLAIRLLLITTNSLFGCPCIHAEVCNAELGRCVSQ
jgi:hypothetical protein